MLLVVITSERVIQSFLGALAAIVLKVVYDGVLFYKKKENIRNFLLTELKNQEDFIQITISALSENVDLIVEDKKLYTLLTVNGMNTNVYKAYSEKEYFSSLNEDEFTKLMVIYNGLEKSLKINHLEFYEKFKAEIKKANTIEEIQDLKDEYSNRMENLIFEADIIKSLIKDLRSILEKKYKSDIY